MAAANAWHRSDNGALPDDETIHTSARFYGRADMSGSFGAFRGSDGEMVLMMITTHDR